LTGTGPANAFGLEAPPAASAAPGTTVSHTLTIINRGNASDNYTLTLAGDLSWPVQIAPTAGPVAPGTSTKIPTTVQIPLTATHGQTQHISIDVTSMGDPDRVASALVDTKVQNPYALAVEPITTTASAEPGGWATFAFRMGNTGSITDTFELTYTSTQQTQEAGWNLPPLPFVYLFPGVWTVIPVHLSVPSSTPEGDYTGEIRITSSGDSAITATLPVTVTVVWHRTYFPEIGRP
jgi:uncharacterized membrane protein